MAAYEVDTLVRLTVTFTAVQGGAAVDPSDVKLYIKPPSGAVQTLSFSSSQITRQSLGNFSYDLLVNAVGNFKYKWQGTGAVQCTTPDGTVSGNATDFQAQLT
jgi:hypothetical protein